MKRKILIIIIAIAVIFALAAPSITALAGASQGRYCPGHIEVKQGRIPTRVFIRCWSGSIPGSGTWPGTWLWTSICRKGLVVVNPVDGGGYRAYCSK